MFGGSYVSPCPALVSFASCFRISSSISTTARVDCASASLDGRELSDTMMIELESAQLTSDRSYGKVSGCKVLHSDAASRHNSEAASTVWSV